MLTSDIPPNQTIYIKNINEKVKKEAWGLWLRTHFIFAADLSRFIIPTFEVDPFGAHVLRLKCIEKHRRGNCSLPSTELKRSLYALFSQYGRILDIVALKTAKLQGQAWVVFSEVAAASNALRQMQNFPFYDKPIRIQYAKTKSDCIAKAEGTYDKKRKQEEKAERKRRVEEDHQTANANGLRFDSNGGATATSREGKSVTQEAAMEPNHILFIQNLPYETNIMMLELLFKQYPGFREVRMVDAKPGIAFVEFDDDSQSSVAMQDLQGFKITAQNPMAITFAKK